MSKIRGVALLVDIYEVGLEEDCTTQPADNPTAGRQNTVGAQTVLTE